MGDIKAKDLNTAGSIAAGDKILGSSINGTTANVTVETVGKYIIDQLNLASLSNHSVGMVCNELKNFGNLFFNVIRKKVEFQSPSNEWEYTGNSITVPANHLYIAYGEVEWSFAMPTGVALSITSSRKSFISKTESGSTNESASKTPVIILKQNESVYLWEKRISAPNNANSCIIWYIDLYMGL